MNDPKNVRTRRPTALPPPKLLNTLPVSRRSSISSVSTRSSAYSRSTLSTADRSSKRSSLSSLASLDSAWSSLSHPRDFHSPAALVKTPQDLARARRSTILTSLLDYRDHFLPARFFNKLPENVYKNILNELRSSHLASDTPGCVECYLNDLRSLAQTSRAWHEMSEKHLFEVLFVSKNYLQIDARGVKSKASSRMKTLRRKLQERPDLASCVKVLYIDGDVTELFRKSLSVEQESIVNTLATLVMVCPNLEAFEGFYPVYDHRFDRLSHALATRRGLKERVWQLTSPSRPATKEDFPHADPVEMFLKHSDEWSQSLKMLCLQGPGSEGCLNYRAFVGTFRKLPSLQQLVISNFAKEDFNDRTAAALPAVRSLRLERLPGVTDKGLSRFARSAAAKSIEDLVLIDLNIQSLSVIRELLLLPGLRRFTLQQDISPDQSASDLYAPAMRSPCLEYLHWDILVPGQAHSVMAKSIRRRGEFPRLRSIRCPSDHHGVFQALCRPVAQMMLDSDHHLINLSTLKKRESTHPARTLPAARCAAQDRIEKARENPSITIHVEEDGIVQHTFTASGYVGQLDSRIRYTLEPDIKGSTSALVQMEDLFDGWGKCSDTQSYPCVGSQSGAKSHKARTRHTPINTSLFF